MHTRTSLVEIVVGVVVFKKTIRTLQSEFPFLKEVKDTFLLYWRRTLRIPHESDFWALKLITEVFEGHYVDIGANQGQSIESIRLFVRDARIIAFEPNPSLFRRLKRRYGRDKRIEIRGLALSDEQRTAKLYVPVYCGFVYDGLASLDRDEAASWISGERVFWFRPARLEISEVQCETTTLDDQDIDDVLFMKIDVQGTEFEVVKGAFHVLKRDEPILMIENGEDRRLVDLLSDMGFSEYSFDGSAFTKVTHRSLNSFFMTGRRYSSIQATQRRGS